MFYNDSGSCFIAISVALKSTQAVSLQFFLHDEHHQRQPAISSAKLIIQSAANFFSFSSGLYSCTHIGDFSLGIFGSRLVFTGTGSSFGRPVAVVVVENRATWATSNWRCDAFCQRKRKHRYIWIFLKLKLLLYTRIQMSRTKEVRLFAVTNTHQVSFF